ncbi:MAG TPA: thioredoxin family protein [Planctomycetota bacterium]|nr:thioredoxin family protein [Planctomycetota bacterium]
MTRLILVLAATAPVALFAPPWVKFDDARSMAASTDKLVAVYATIGANGTRDVDNSETANEALACKAVAARYGEFFWVNAADPATAKRVDAPSNGANLIFVDPDGVSLGVWNVQSGGEKAVLAALDEAKAKYRPKPVSWCAAEPEPVTDPFKRRLIVYAFLDGKEASQKVEKALEHAWVAKDHGRMAFHRVEDLASPIAKRFKVTSVPTLIFYDPSMKEGKEVIDRRSSEITARIVRIPVSKFLDKVRKDLIAGK